MAELERFIHTLSRYRLLTLAGLVVSGCVCAAAGLLLYRPGPPADSIIYVYEQSGAFGINTTRPDGTMTLPLFYSNPAPARLAQAWETAPRGLRRSLASLIEQPIPHHPVWIGGGRKIAFRIRLHGQDCEEVLTMAANGREPEVVTCLSRDYRDEAIAWSPDGEHLAIARRAASLSALTILDSTGIVEDEFYFPDTVWGLSWSPDSMQLAVTLDSADSLQLIQPGLPRQILKPETLAFGQPAWSPAGDRFAFLCVSSERINICTLNTDGTNHQRIEFPPGFPYLKHSLSWSPRGDSLLFEAVQPSGYNDLFLVNADGTGLRQITFHPAADTHPAWSPDGSQITFTSMRDGNWELYVIQADGSGLTRVTNTPGHERQPAWRPGNP